MTLTTTLHDRLTDCRGRKRDLRESIRVAQQDEKDKRQALLASANSTDTSSPEFRAYQQAREVAQRLQNQEGLIKDEERYLLSQAAGVTDDFGGYESFLRDPEKLRSLAEVANSSAPIGRLQMGPAVGANELISMMGSAFVPRIGAQAAPGQVEVGDGARRATWYGVVPQLRRPLRLIDLFNAVPMTGNSFEYAQEVGDLATGVGPTAEGQVKPADTVDYIDTEAFARTIATHTRMKKQQLADVPALESVVRDRLIYKVFRSLEFEIISGDGTGQHLVGLLNTGQIADLAFTAGELAADQVLDGIGAVLVSEAEPNFVALHPLDYISMLKEKSAGDGQYYSGGPFVAAAERIWNVATVPSTGVAQGSAIIGDSRGATIFVREGVNALISDSDQDNFVRNMVTLLAEGRFGFAVWTPGAFARARFV